MLMAEYIKFRPVTEEEKEIFEKAMKKLGKVGYDPLLVSTEVFGANYRFVCNAEIPGIKPVYCLAGVTISVPESAENPEPVVAETEQFYNRQIYM